MAYPKTKNHGLPREVPTPARFFCVGSFEGFVSAGLYPDGTPCEVSVTLVRSDPVVANFLKGFSRRISDSLQKGDPLHAAIKNFKYATWRQGYTRNQVLIIHSTLEFAFKWFENGFYVPEYRESARKELHVRRG